MISALLLCLAPQVGASTPDARVPYVPPRGSWQARTPRELGFDPELLEIAVRFAKESEANTPTDVAEFIRQSFGHEPFSSIDGPTKDRAAQNGVLIKDGYIVAEWGDTQRADMTFSVTKTYLSTVVGLAVARGLIGDVHDPVARTVHTPHFEGERHGAITWDQMLRQTSDWRGTLWGKPAWADRPPRGATDEEARAVPMREPGASWEYNDVCVNLLAYAALEVWREPLPRVLLREVMDPIGASRTWRWHGYSTSWVELDGARVQSVSGGGHHGGGMFVSTRDQARFGLLFLRGGAWGERQIVATDWIAAARTPTDVKPDYGYMNWFLNTPGVNRDGAPTRPWPAAPESAVMFRGAGANLVYIDVENDLVLCVRWIDGRRMNGLIERVLAARLSPVGRAGR